MMMMDGCIYWEVFFVKSFNRIHVCEAAVLLLSELRRSVDWRDIGTFVL